jgi:hypothetical protein
MGPSLLLTGLDAQNPLGFFAALGMLRVMDAHAVREGRPRPWLSFYGDGQTPSLGTSLRLDEVIATVIADARSQRLDPVLTFAYTDAGERASPDDKHARCDLKPSPKLALEFLMARATEDRGIADLAAGLFSELVQDNNGATKPTALHFTAGQQEFLRMVQALRAGLTEAALREALIGPWLNASSLPSLSWDSSATRSYALRARNPSSEKRGSVPAANWLAVQSLAFFPVVVRRRRLATVCVTGGWKDSRFTWPLWDAKLTVPVVSSLLRIDAGGLTAKERAATSVTAVLSARILRSDQGGYGSFSPADIVLPVERSRRS